VNHDPIALLQALAALTPEQWADDNLMLSLGLRTPEMISAAKTSDHRPDTLFGRPIIYVDDDGGRFY
jgi:hypothetical protein